jgi:hypothetical protein
MAARRHSSHASPFLHKQKRWETWMGPAFVVQAKHVNKALSLFLGELMSPLFNLILACLKKRYSISI